MCYKYPQPGQNFGPNICLRKFFSANYSNDVFPFGAIAFMQIWLLHHPLRWMGLTEQEVKILLLARIGNNSHLQPKDVLDCLSKAQLPTGNLRYLASY